MSQHLACKDRWLDITTLGIGCYQFCTSAREKNSRETWVYTLVCSPLHKMLGVLASVCRVFLIRYDDSASTFVLHSKSHGCVWDVLLLSGTGDVSPSHCVVLGWNWS